MIFPIHQTSKADTTTTKVQLQKFSLFLTVVLSSIVKVCKILKCHKSNMCFFFNIGSSLSVLMAF